MPAEWLAEYDGPVGVGEVISVDTRRPVDIAALSARIERAWSETPDTSLPEGFERLNPLSADGQYRET